MITIPNLEHSQERGRMLLDIYAHTQRRLSLNFCSQLLARQLSSLTSSQLYARQLSSLHVKSVLCTSSQLSAPGGLSRPGQASAWAAPVSVCQRLANACQHLDRACQHLDRAWATPGPRMGHQCQEILTVPSSRWWFFLSGLLYGCPSTSII